MAKIYLAIDGGGTEHVFTQWSRCKDFVHGNPYRFCGAESVEAARIKLGLVKPVNADGAAPAPEERPTYGLCCDAGTRGNPGPCEYQVADLAGNILQHAHLGIGTNNYAELSGILAALILARATANTVVWTDSQVCLDWIRTGRVGERVARRDQVCALVAHIQTLLQARPVVSLRKWNTRAWGEIPADFGRK